MVDLTFFKKNKQLPWKSFSIPTDIHTTGLSNQKTSYAKSSCFTIHPEDKDKINITYDILNSFCKPEEDFPELTNLRSKKDFADFKNIFYTKQLHALLTIKKNQSLKHPVLIKIPNQKNQNHFCYAIKAEQNSSSTFYETYKAETSPIEFHHSQSFIQLQDNAQINFISENSKAHANTSIRHMNNYLGPNSRFFLNYYSIEDASTPLPEKLSSLYNVHTFLMGEAANFFEQALILAKDKKNRQHYSNIYHLKPYGSSSQLHKAMLDDSAKSVFNALIFIASNCPQVNSQQLNNNLSFSKAAKIISQPQLQVKTDDVKAAHGSTTGQVQAEELYYLQARGISLKKAKQLLKQAFISELQKNINNLEIKTKINTLLKGYDE